MPSVSLGHALLQKSKPCERKLMSFPPSVQRDVACLTCRVGGMLIRLKCVRSVHVLAGPFLFHTLGHCAATSGVCFCREKSQEAPPQTDVPDFLSSSLA